MFLFTLSILSGPEVVRRSATKLLLVVLSSVLFSTLSSCRFFWLILRVRVRRQVPFGLLALFLPSRLQLRVTLGILSSGVLRTCPMSIHFPARCLGLLIYDLLARSVSQLFLTHMVKLYNIHDVSKVVAFKPTRSFSNFLKKEVFT